MNQPQRWRGNPSSPIGALVSLAVLLSVLFLTSGCVYMAMFGAVTNAAQFHKMNELEKRIERQEAAPRMSSSTSPSDMALDRSSK